MGFLVSLEGIGGEDSAGSSPSRKTLELLKQNDVGAGGGGVKAREPGEPIRLIKTKRWKVVPQSRLKQCRRGCGRDLDRAPKRLTRKV